MTNSEANEILARHGRQDIVRMLSDRSGDPHYMTADGRIRRISGGKIIPVSRHAVALVLLGHEGELLHDKTASTDCVNRPSS